MLHASLGALGGDWGTGGDWGDWGLGNKTSCGKNKHMHICVVAFLLQGWLRYEHVQQYYSTVVGQTGTRAQSPVSGKSKAAMY